MRITPTRRRSRPKRDRLPDERAGDQRADYLPPHGAQIGRIVIEYYGQAVEVPLFQAGDKCRTHGVLLDAEVGPEVMGLYRALARAGALLARVPGERSMGARQEGYTAQDEIDAMAA